MRKQLTEQAQIGKNERLAQRFIFRVANRRYQANQSGRDEGGEDRATCYGEYYVDYPYHRKNVKQQRRDGPPHRSPRNRDAIQSE
ncbi:hypothetical protein F01_320122 [Burkholderia cenocepacia]|nr:hypothetical protein F01_320122 [Burkholderia cenocepacia]